MNNPGTQNKIGRNGMFGQVVGQYNEYGNTLRQSFSMRELAEKLMDIADFAEHTLTNETAGNDWYDAHTIRRNVKEMRAYVKEFGKLAEEYDTIRTRATALYDDMGRVLERYFESRAYDTDDDQQDDLVAGNIDKDPVMNSPTKMTHENDMEVEQPEVDEPQVRRTQMRERLVSMARHKLRGEQLVTFDTLPPNKQLMAAYRIVK